MLTKIEELRLGPLITQSTFALLWNYLGYDKEGTNGEIAADNYGESFASKFVQQ